ncbi:MAG: hypothetical protein Q8Q08_06770 [Candidatus Omnitrophota bacterium]|nr:hypothetical protein [Candidatus Omnitrophota bacterium]MDZ4241641.1 hypothetical protein [Candidatus Omnitrophota bacterium]
MTNRNAILLIVGLTFLAYFNSLFNGFIGDTHFLYIGNSFYHDSRNLFRLLTPDFVMGLDQVPAGVQVEEPSVSGFVSYRPVTALTFFLDYFLWRDWAFGHHLSNVLLHIFVSILVYRIFLFLAVAPAVACLGALIFSLHPVQAELVNNGGYRSDLVMTLFYLAAFWAYGRLRQGGGKRQLFYGAACYAFFFLGLLSKESAVILPVMIAVYDALMPPTEGPWRTFWPGRFKLYAGFLLVVFLYAAVYFLVFPGLYMQKSLALQGSHGPGTAVEIFFQYAAALVLPFKTTILPPLYAPLAGTAGLLGVLCAAVVVVGGTAFAAGRFRRDKLPLFALLWFLFNYIPVSNVVTLLNPYAYRFLYLPSIGFALLSSLALERLLSFLASKSSNLALDRLAVFAVLGICLSVTFSLNGFFKTDRTACLEMIRNYPDASRPYWVLGLDRYEKQQYEDALAFFQRYMETPPRNPYVPDPKNNFAVYHLMARCYGNDVDKALPLLETAVRLNPGFALVHADLARVYVIKSDFPKALSYAREVIRLAPRLAIGYVYAVHSLVMLGEKEEAARLFEAVSSLAPSDENLPYLKALLRNHGI